MIKALGVVLLLALGGFYVAAATVHGRVVNTSKARGDQSGYLADAERAYANWHGQTPPFLIGERNRMPLYAGYLALFYNPRLTDPEFFEVAKTWNIRLSLALLVLLYLIFRWHLPALVSTNLILIVAFGYFVFKAGYAQSELLFYFLFFVTFLSGCYLLVRRSAAASLGWGALTGTLAALAHLTKAGVLPLVAILLVVYFGREVGLLVRRRASIVPIAWRAVGGLLMAGCFLALLYPYISNSKRVFGQYFYNVNTTFYALYENWPEASVGPYSHGDGVGWPAMPEEQLMSAHKYWTQHTVGQIAARIGSGIEDMVIRSYVTFWYLKYVAIYVAFAVALAITNRQPFMRLVRRHAALALFLVLYAIVYVAGIGFYAPTSGTGTTRFLLADVAPLLFVLSAFIARPPFADTRWTVGDMAITPEHFHIFVFVTIALDLSFTLWPHLMTTYGGF